MNAIPLINIAPPRNDNVNRVSNKLNNIPVSQNISGAVGMLVNSGFNNEAQLRQEVNTSIVALKREAFNLETLINQAAKTLTDVNNRIAALENVQGDYVKKTDVTNTIESGNMNPLTSNAVATSNAMPVNSVTSGNLHSVTSGAVANYASKIIKYKEVTISNITFNNGGYVDVESYFPDGMTNFLFAMLRGWGSVSAHTPLAIETTGKWLWCSPNATCSNVYIRYYYTD